MAMMEYYLLSGLYSSPVASAFAPEGTPLAHELIPKVGDSLVMPFELSLIKLSVEKNGIVKSSDLSGLNNLWLDYLPNSLAWPLFSYRLMTVVENNLTGNEGINWVKATVNGGGERREYFIPRFTKPLDVLDVKRTTFIRGTDQIIKPFFSIEKIEKYSVFTRPAHHDLWKITSSIYVSEQLKLEIQKERLTGIEFEKTRVA